MKKLLFAIATGAVMLTSGVNTDIINAKEQTPIVVNMNDKTDKEVKTKRAKKFAQLVTDYIEEEENTFIEKVEIDSINRKGTRANFTAYEFENKGQSERVYYMGTIKKEKTLFGKTKIVVNIDMSVRNKY